MKIATEAIPLINNLQTRLRLASVLKFSETWIRELINNNKDNGPLTTAAALEVIREETGLKQEEILESEVPSEIGQ